MTQTAADRRIVARELARRIYEAPDATAVVDLDDLVAAVGAIDDTMDLLPAALTVNRTVKQNFIDSLPEPFKSNSTAQQKATALVVWAMKEVGLI